MKRVNPSYVKLDKIEPDLSQLHLTESKLKNQALHHNRGMSIYQTRLITPFQPHKAKTLSR